MRRVKRAAWSFLAIISLLGVSGCMSFMSNSPDRAEIAKKLLKEKYNEDFSIFTSGEGYGTLTNNTFKVVAAPEGKEELKFEAKIQKEGNWIIDEYVEALLEDEIKQTASDKIRELTDKFFIKVYVGFADTKYTDKSMVSIEKFTKEYTKVPIVITLLLDKTSVSTIDAEKEYQVLQELFAEKLPINAALEIYYTDGETIEKSEEYFKKNAEAYDDFHQMLKGFQENGFGLDDGQINIPLNQYIDQRQVQ
ncbi:hypothetical protein [Bacillus sp. OK048]|uniref:hypothetical protein n=1 Tax=Bacillus sp. OK048 TaxID=1882761 RepID=UPI00087E8ED6|nr:hypothetical protein [Bacillus sp. OK048]SDM84981.1 hypothetical protein SAMN05443253_10644 [Bacillus sp. OK048]